MVYWPVLKEDKYSSLNWTNHQKNPKKTQQKTQPWDLKPKQKTKTNPNQTKQQQKTGDKISTNQQKYPEKCKTHFTLVT